MSGGVQCRERKEERTSGGDGKGEFIQGRRMEREEQEGVK